MTGERAAIDGYVSESLYPSSFHNAFSPPWTDAILRHEGVVPPRDRRTAFTLVDLGCGDGIGLALMAAAHPEGHFIGIDAMPAHIAHGKAVIGDLGLPNIELHCATFQDALDHVAPERAHYVTAQGVLAWVSPENRVALFDLAARLLRPGGAFTLGYNAFPGWTPMVPFQRMIRALALEEEGDQVTRYEAALAKLRTLDLLDPGVFEWLDGLPKSLPASYFAHEYLHSTWNPLWASEVIELSRAHGLEFVCDAKAAHLRPDFALKAQWRATLDAIASTGAREVALDMLRHNWFRTDVHVKSPARTSEAATAEARLAGWWASYVAPEDALFTLKTTAGTIRYDNDAARAILATLAAGPNPLSAVPGIGAADLLNTIDALFMSGQVVPVDPPADVPHAAAVNAMARGKQDGPLNGLAGRHGAVGFGRGDLARLSADHLRRAGIEAD